MFEEITTKFNVPFKRCGSLLIARNEEQVKKLDEIYEKAIKRGINHIEIIEGKQIYEEQPNLNIAIKKALYSKKTGVVAPYDLAIAYGEVAFDNGVNFKLEEEVIDIQKISKGYKIITNKNKFTCRTVINTTPGIDYNIDNSEKEKKELNISISNSILISKKHNSNSKNILFTLSDNNKAISIVNNIQKSTLFTIESYRSLNFQDMKESLNNFVQGIEEKDVKAFFQSKYYKEPILIDDSLIDKGYIKISGKHYAEVTMTPSIAKMVCETLVGNLNAKVKKDFVDKRRDVFRFREFTNEEKNQIIKLDKKYGKVICLCETVTEGEIVDAIRRPLGARTVEGVRRRTGVTFGDCEGAYCFDRIVSILARETNKSINDIVKSSKGSRVVKGRIKEFNEM
jgi:L-2-hydroxyglutarate oxidase LhgO